MLKEIGLGKNTLSNMEKSKINCVVLAEIADYLGCSADYLLGREANDSELTVDEIELLSNYRVLSQMDKGRVLQKAEDLAEAAHSASKADVS